VIGGCWSGGNEWKFFGALLKGDPLLAFAWWTVLILRGVLPAAFAIAMGVLVAAVQRGDSLGGPLTLMGVIFILLQVLTPVHQAISANLGDRTAAWLRSVDSLPSVRRHGPPRKHDAGHGLTVARDPIRTPVPPFNSVDFIAGGLVEMIAGIACALVFVFTGAALAGALATTGCW
jgi:hypothetical protein